MTMDVQLTKYESREDWLVRRDSLLEFAGLN